MQIVSLKDTPLDFRVGVAKELGCEVDSDGIHLVKAGERALDPYSKEPLRLDNIAVLPGSVVLLDNNPVSIAWYLEVHGDIL
ncbi:MAG: hypothetical protein L3J95_02425 [Thermoplasmata archaeon]|nr:hypothetical protein [Thermoplasmata archaeon]MCI4359262.1 hypothetical protein [Thermoplasmata archaeon]